MFQINLMIASDCIFFSAHNVFEKWNDFYHDKKTRFIHSDMFTVTGA